MRLRMIEGRRPSGRRFPAVPEGAAVLVTVNNAGGSGGGVDPRLMKRDKSVVALDLDQLAMLRADGMVPERKVETARKWTQRQRCQACAGKSRKAPARGAE